MNRPFLWCWTDTPIIRMPFLPSLALCMLLVGCSPDLDWREVHPDGGGFSVWLPARPNAQSRPLNEGGGPPVVMWQWSARARETAFAAGYVDYPERPEAETLLSALVRNINGRVTDRRNVRAGDIPGIEIRAAGTASGSELELRLRVFPMGSRLYEAAVLGRPGDLTEADVETFFGSFKIEVRR